MVPIVCVLAPLICLGITYGPLIMTYFDPNYKVENWMNGYAFGHEMLILNGGLTFILLYLTSTATTEKATA
jgi:hypothetical protein